MTTTVCTLPVEPVGESGGFPYDPTVRVLFAEDILNPAMVTREEMDYAVDTTDLYCLVDLNGWEVISDVIVDPPWGLFDSQRPGSLRMRSTGSTLTYAADKFGNDIREILRRGVRGWVLILPAGDVPGALMHVYPVWTSSVTPLQRLRNDGAQIEVLFAINSQPQADVRIPADDGINGQG